MRRARRACDEHLDERREFEIATTPDAELIQRYFDREVGELELGELLQRVAKSPAAWREIAETQDLIDELSAPDRAPDLSARILARLEADPASPLHRTSRLAALRRYGGVAAAVMLGASLLLVNRVASRFDEASGPSLTRVLEAPRQDAQLIRSLGEGLNSIRNQLGAAELRLEQQESPRFIYVGHPEQSADDQREIHLPERRLHWLQSGSQRLHLDPRDSATQQSVEPDAQHASFPFI